ncbi:Tyrosine-protein kinase CSK [Acropora cervicornis]|uniref:Tyrosine-protein kinase n=1 Tax=Acropora cervicornis TaxID=6130 RepID=A0AAD9Q2Q5_ACRCE|nr:Tyrosine-protein kinase CSK [Acropora cervicornis]
MSGNNFEQSKPWPHGTAVVGKYEFKGRSPEDLPFKKDELLYIESVTRDPHWYRAKNVKGRKGMIPYNYVKQWDQKGAVKLHAMPWFHGKITREKAEELLKPYEEGLFLVRESHNYQGDYTLSVCCGPKVDHYRVRYTDDNKLSVDDEVYFENLTKLVQHYEKDADGLSTRLAKPLEKKGGKFAFSVDPESFRKGLDNKAQRTATWEFHREGRVWRNLSHKNLVKLLGVSLDGSPIYIVTEFCGKGSLVEYLRTRGRTVIGQKDLIGFARDIAAGMQYLESKLLVHRDLAARNVLVHDDGTAKVSDFGLARGADFNLEGGKFPIKWTAPEAIKQGQFSTQSDVWSYGVLLWELFSFGRTPYPRVHIDSVMDTIEKGYRMECPDGCPQKVYIVMRDCWEINPKLRPSFEKIYTTLDDIYRSFVTGNKCE